MNRPSQYRNVRTPLSPMAAVSATAGLLSVAVDPAEATKGEEGDSLQNGKPTVVLVHGAFADSSSWNDVIKQLKRHGYPVVAAANPLRGLTGDAAHIKSLLASIAGPVVLVGHSYGGAVITNAAHGSDQVKALVYIAAFIPDKDESADDLAKRFPGSSLADALRPVPCTLPDGSPGVDLYIDQDRFHHQFAADVHPYTTNLMAATQRPVTVAALEEASGEPAWKTIPSWSLVAGEDLNIPREAQMFMARRAESHMVVIHSSHAASVSHPGDVADIIERAARSVR
ncbi:alpha/beta fold hydrolase [Actinacidiphila glaucinigra]|uniref:alpha/beta fold hydrolase n=1 Tax=Actinacidiphila glaucinigra TaxID=235986 RepID=UPI003670C0C0